MVLDQTGRFDFICKDRTSGVLLARQVLFRAMLLRLWTNPYTFKTNKCMSELAYITVFKKKKIILGYYNCSQLIDKLESLQN